MFWFLAFMVVVIVIICIMMATLSLRHDRAMGFLKMITKNHDNGNQYNEEVHKLVKKFLKQCDTDTEL